MSLQRLTAENGYDYLTRQVAAQDATERGRSSLASYYSERGEAPGRWIGNGVGRTAELDADKLGVEGLAVGDVVTEEQMKSLFGLGMHPLANQRIEHLIERQQKLLTDPQLTDRARRRKALAAISPEAQLRAETLGTPYRVDGLKASELQQQVAIRAREFNHARGAVGSASIPVTVMARIRSEVGRELFHDVYRREPLNERELAGFIASQSRPARTTVSGFDLTFSPVKSVSAVWALADPTLAAHIEAAHNEAINDALTYLEQHALFTRLGRNGVRQVETNGLVATAFTHRDSRAGDPDLHTHVAVANKVQTLDGKWRTIDSRTLYRAAVTASETYNTALQTRLEALGLRFEQRAEPGRRKRPVYELVGVDTQLLRAWSKRRGNIEERQGQLAAQFQTGHGRPPTPVEMLRLAQQATLETRNDKHAPRTLAEQRDAWRREAVTVLGGEQHVRQMMHAVKNASRPRTHVDNAWIEHTSAQILATLEGSRATWRVTNIRAEAQRRVRGANVQPERVDDLVSLLVAHVVDASTPLASGDLPVAGPTPASLLRRDGSSVYTVAGAQRYTSHRIMAAEHNLVGLAGQTGAQIINQAAIEAAIDAQAAHGRVLNAGQAQLVRSMALSGAKLQLAIAPAGSGKTTAMSALTDAWQRDGHHVYGFAPSAAAAAELSGQIGSSADTLAKLVHELDQPDSPMLNQMRAGDLVIIDEAAMADTLSLNTAVAALVQRGIVVRLIGDDQQLAAIGAGGVLRDIEHSHGAARLDELMRFSDRAEALATLGLREGNTEALGFYFDRDRIHVGDAQLVTAQLFDAWHADTRAGRDALMLAPTRDVVADLNRRARAARMVDHPETRRGAEVRLADGNLASRGDVIITRTNDRRLRLSATDWVKNGDRWTITDTSPDGSMRARHNQHQLTITLPASYVRDHVELGYATTVHSAQGVSADTMHGLITGTESRQLFYTMMSRGRHANHAYLDYTASGEPDSTVWAETTAPATPTEVLHGILGRDGAPASALSSEREALSAAAQLGHAAALYQDALTMGAEELLGPDTVAAITGHLEQRVPGIAADPAWDTLRAHLLWAAANGESVIDRIDQTLAQRDLGDARDRAAVLTWRLDLARDLYQGGPLPWLPAVPALLQHDEQMWRSFMAERRQHVLTQADRLRAEITNNPVLPAWLPAGMPQPSVPALADVAVWRAANQIPDTDHRITGPVQPGRIQARYQRHLEARVTAPLQAARDEWAQLLRGLAPQVATDPQLDHLTVRLAALTRHQIPARQLLTAALTQGPLPDDHAAAAMWWRIVADLTPAQQSAATSPRTDWTPALVDRVGGDVATQLQHSAAWPALRAAIDHALDRGWAPEDLLVPVEPIPGRDPADELLWRTLTITDQPADDQTAPDPRDEHHEPDPEDLPILEAFLSKQIVSSPLATQDSGAEWWLRESPSLDEADDPELGQRAGGEAAWTPDPQVQLYLAGLSRPARPGPLLPTDADVREWSDRANRWLDHPIPTDRLYAVNQAAQEFYTTHYPHSWAAEYLTERFGSDLTHTTFAPGYAPNQAKALITALQHQGFTRAELLAAGVALESRYDEQLIDRFRDRVMFPIHDHTGQIAGFVGRRNPTSERGPKYLNTAETPIFHKGAQFFGTRDGRPAPDQAAVIVEGPMDAMAVTLAGDGRYTGLAPMGTSLTTDQASLLAEHRHPVILATDNDIAGQVAAERDFWRLAAYGHDPLHARFEPGDDPASQLQRDGAGTLHATLSAAAPAARTMQLERIRNLPPEQALTQALQITGARPSNRWNDDLGWMSDRLAVSKHDAERQLAPIAQAWTDDPRARADEQIAASSDVRERLTRQDPSDVWMEALAEIDPRLPHDPSRGFVLIALQSVQDEGLDPVTTVRTVAEQAPLGNTPATTLAMRLYDNLDLPLPTANSRPTTGTQQPSPARRNDELDHQLYRHDLTPSHEQPNR